MNDKVSSQNEKEEAQIITTLAEHMRNVEVMMRNYINTYAKIKEVEDQQGKNIKNIYEKIEELETAIQKLTESSARLKEKEENEL